MCKYPIVIPVFNRPEEVDELLESLVSQSFKDFEVIIVEDGSSETCDMVVAKYTGELAVRYHYKENAGPALARNHALQFANGKWLIFLDSDCFVPPSYLQEVETYIRANQIDLFGGPDRDHPSFTTIQRGISYAMTSLFTTGGIRGGKSSMEKFKPRSFNMGVRKDVFEELGGFTDMRFAEDIDLSIRAEKKGYKSHLIAGAFAFHKRRSTIWQFYKQIYNSGVARIVLNKLHPGSLRLVHLLPAVFVVSNLMIILAGFYRSGLWLMLLPYPAIIFLHSLVQSRKIMIALHAVIASYVQLVAYGFGFINALLSRSVKHSYVENLYD